MPTRGLRTPWLDSPPLVRRGLPELVYGATPAVATDFVQKIVGQDFARLISVFVRIVTDANVASREVVVEYRDAGALRFALAGAPVVVTAGSTNDYAFNVYQGQADWPEDSTILVPLPPILLMPTFDFRIHIVNVQAGDQLSQIRFEWERFYTFQQPPDVTDDVYE